MSVYLGTTFDQPVKAGSPDESKIEAFVGDGGSQNPTTVGFASTTAPSFIGPDLDSMMKEPLYDIKLPGATVDEALLSSNFDWSGEGNEAWQGGGDVFENGASSDHHVHSVIERVWGFVQDLKQHYDVFDEGFKGLWDCESSFNQVFLLVERLALTQAQFKASGRNALIDIGYHYTNEQNIRNIQQRGLLTKEERDAFGIRSKFNGAMHGNGVYMGNNPFAFCNSSFGGFGLLVARIRGMEARSRQQRHWEGDQDVDTKTAGTGFQQMVILRWSKQCVPLASFSSSILETDNDESTGNARIFNLHFCLQGLLDKYFNDSFPTLVSRVLPSESPEIMRRNRRRAQRARCRKQRVSTVTGHSGTLAQATPLVQRFGLPQQQQQQPPGLPTLSALPASTSPTSDVPLKAPPLVGLSQLQHAADLSTYPALPASAGAHVKAPPLVQVYGLQQQQYLTGLSAAAALPTSITQTIPSFQASTERNVAQADSLYNATINGGKLEQDVIDILLNL